MKKRKRLLIWVLLTLFSLLLVAAIACFKPLDSTLYTQCDFYQKELDEIQKINPSFSKDTVKVGWSRINLLPLFTTPIAIDAHRGGKHFEGVHDSIYVRAFVFKSGPQKIAFVSADLLIIPPSVTQIFDSILVKQGYSPTNIFFTATHTHTSIGAWHNSYVGELFAGKFDARVPQHIAECIAKAIVTAEENCEVAKIGFAEFPTTHLVFNRLVKNEGKVDSMLRIVKIEKVTGEKSAIITFAAHCTVFHENLMRLSNDWAGLMMQQLNKSGKINFASFSAGAVGSQGPYEVSANQEEEAKYMGFNTARIVQENFDSIPTYFVTHMNMLHLPLYLREPEMRVTQNIVIRPWLFKKLFGDEKVYINTFQVGNILFAGMPCDFSGELVAPLDSAAHQRNLNLLITGFNGEYIGYITDTKWYGLKTYETRTMGWFGPGNGDYLSEVLMREMEK